MRRTPANCPVPSAVAAILLTFATFAISTPLHNLPEIYYDAETFVTIKGYPFEQHQVKTLDGYILQLHRVPHGLTNNPNGAQGSRQPKPVVFLQHGLLMSSDDWVIDAANKSLAFILADAGYDVWMGNSRGNKYSRLGATSRIDSPAYWMFSFDEMANYDLPAMIDFIHNETGQKINYVGHSQGSLIGFCKFSDDPDWARSRIVQFHALGPIAYLRHVETAMKYVAPLTSLAGSFMKLVGYNEFFANSAWLEGFANRICGNSFLKSICTNALFLFCGYNADNIDPARLPIYMAHSPAGTSTTNMIHFGQLINSKKLQHFDYGLIKNLLIYRNAKPPLYDVSKLSVPTVLYYSSTDQMATLADVADLAAEIDHVIVGSHSIPGVAHLDFAWGVNAPTHIYPLILKHLATSYGA